MIDRITEELEQEINDGYIQNFINVIKLHCMNYKNKLKN